MTVRHIDGGIHSVQPHGDLFLWSLLSKKELLSGPNAPKEQILQEFFALLSDGHVPGSLPRYVSFLRRD